MSLTTIRIIISRNLSSNAELNLPPSNRVPKFNSVPLTVTCKHDSLLPVPCCVTGALHPTQLFHRCLHHLRGAVINVNCCNVSVFVPVRGQAAAIAHGGRQKNCTKRNNPMFAGIGRYREIATSSRSGNQLRLELFLDFHRSYERRAALSNLQWHQWFGNTLCLSWASRAAGIPG